MIEWQWYPFSNIITNIFMLIIVYLRIDGPCVSFGPNTKPFMYEEYVTIYR